MGNTVWEANRTRASLGGQYSITIYHARYVSWSNETADWRLPIADFSSGTIRENPFGNRQSAIGNVLGQHHARMQAFRRRVVITDGYQVVALVAHLHFLAVGPRSFPNSHLHSITGSSHVVDT